jgi:hypothetical protein
MWAGGASFSCPTCRWASGGLSDGTGNKGRYKCGGRGRERGRGEEMKDTQGKGDGDGRRETEAAAAAAGGKRRRKKKRSIDKTGDDQGCLNCFSWHI